MVVKIKINESKFPRSKSKTTGGLAKYSIVTISYLKLGNGLINLNNSIAQIRVTIIKQYPITLTKV
jgi:hypothetical protein